MDNVPTKHQLDLAKRCIAEAKQQMGAGWDHISPDLQWGLVCAAIMGKINTFDDDAPDASFRRYVTKLHVVCRELMDAEPVRFSR